MTAHAPTVDATTVAARVAQLPHLSMDSLWALWDEYFEERPKHHHRTWLESRLAYRIQERAFGGLKPATRRKLEEIGETGILPRQLRHDANRLLPGTVLTRIFDDVEHRVLVLQKAIQLSTFAWRFDQVRQQQAATSADVLTSHCH